MNESNINEQGVFIDLVNKVAPLIANHPITGFDLKVANWLDPTGQLYKEYAQWKNSPSAGQSQAPDLQCRQLFEFWKALVGRRKATLKQFQAHLEGKDMTADILDRIKEDVVHDLKSPSLDGFQVGQQVQKPKQKNQKLKKQKWKNQKQTNQKWKSQQQKNQEQKYKKQKNPKQKK